MAMTENELTELRSWVPWDPPTDAELQARYDVLGTWQNVAYEQLRIRRMELISEPSSFAISGEYSQSTGENIRALDEMMSELAGASSADELDAGSSGLTMARLVRVDPYGRAAR